MQLTSARSFSALVLSFSVLSFAFLGCSKSSSPSSAKPALETSLPKDISPVSKDSQSLCESTSSQQRDALRKAYREIEGTYTSKIVDAKGATQSTAQIQINPSEVDLTQCLYPAFGVIYTTLNNMPGDGIGEYNMWLSYVPKTGMFSMHATYGSDGPVDKTFLVLSGTIKNGLMAARVNTESMFLGTFTASQKNQPPPFDPNAN